VLRAKLHQRGEGKGPHRAQQQTARLGTTRRRRAVPVRTRAEAKGRGKELGMVAAAVTAERRRNHAEGRIRRGRERG
jgi:hypothetical protein